MNRPSLFRLSIILGLAGPLTLLNAVAARADYYPTTWAEQQAFNAQRQQAALQQQASQGVNQSTLQMQRWENEWRQQHPGEPMPNMGKLQQMHSAELINGVRARGAQMWSNRQAELQRNYQWARQNQLQQNAAAGVTWSPAQWQAWDRSYDQQQHQNAIDYQNGIRQAGEIFNRQEEDRKRREMYSPYQ